MHPDRQLLAPLTAVVGFPSFNDVELVVIVMLELVYFILNVIQADHGSVFFHPLKMSILLSVD